VVPQLCREQMESMGVTCKPIDNPAIERRVGIFTRKRHALSRAASALAEQLGDYFHGGI
jgi:LysR family transcriptional regulator, carnitine catabolism transcriptional activator